MRRKSAMTLIEIVIVISVLLLIIGILLPVLAAARRGGRGLPVRGIHNGLVLYAQGNNSHYPGVLPDGVTIDPAVGLTTLGRVQKLIEGNYITLEYARSQSEAQTGTTSYAMLKIDVGSEENTIAKSIRNSEWNDTRNNQAIVVSDRAVDNGGSYTHIKSIHTNPQPGTSSWYGIVVWNDNHVTFESTFNQFTKYDTTTHTADNLFATPDPNNGDDAFMVWHGTDGL